MLQNDYLIAKIGVDTAENELFKIWWKLQNATKKCNEFGEPAQLAA